MNAVDLWLIGGFIFGLILSKLYRDWRESEQLFAEIRFREAMINAAVALAVLVVAESIRQKAIQSKAPKDPA